MKRIIYSIPLIPVALTASAFATTSCNKNAAISLTLKDNEISSKKTFGLETSLVNNKTYSIEANLKDWTVSYSKPTRTDWANFNMVSIIIQSTQSFKPGEESKHFVDLEHIKVKLNDQELELSTSGGFNWYFDQNLHLGRINIFDGTTKIPYDAKIVIENIACKEDHQVAITTQRAK